MSLDKMQVVDRNEVSYRRPLAVKKVLVYHGGYSYPVCPKCNMTLDREYMNFCDRCGQMLDWKGYRKAVVVRVK